MPSKLRLQRIGDRIRQDLSEMIVMGEIRDPRIAGITITDVTIDRELAYADVYLSALEGSERAVEALQGFTSASGYIRRALSDRIELRVFPRLRFHWDPTPERADRIERLLADLREDQPVEPAEESEEELDE
ncbi:MAG TPA: 30S ribosome-binding factor RbfA [Anaerolineaceae bacterium]|nr:MAG: ribosome-binding factor A [Chloroflexi bacterium GWB2_54_36]HAL15645.1 30S ribosome-binding factor RbfA [Anaerolineaceae bacterium]HBA92139.1 30S ribosome-binding factor RbfA [Anaerolineaceae bacterium]